MKALMISANTERINMPTMPLGLACVVEATRRAGHGVVLLDLMAENDQEKNTRRIIEDLSPGVIGISVRNIDDQDIDRPKFLLEPVKELVSYCRRFSGAPVVLGGAGYSMFPESALEYVGADMGIQGEGESSFPELLDRLRQHGPLKGVPGLYVRGQGSQGERTYPRDLDRFPLPGPDLLSTKAYEGELFWLPVQTRRGCPMRCSYCSTGTIEGTFIRKRSPEEVVHWLKKWFEKGFRRFQFVDNTFNLPRSYAVSLCKLISESLPDLEWRCILYPGNVDRELVKEMKRAGCRDVSIGFESGSERILKGMNKKFGLEDIRRSSGLLSEYGIGRMGFLLLGGPGETRVTVMESLRFVDSLDLETGKITVGIRIYPYTQVAAAAVQEGLLSEEDGLLFPRFYIVRDIQEWLRKTVKDWTEQHQNWVM